MNSTTAAPKSSGEAHDTWPETCFETFKGEGGEMKCLKWKLLLLMMIMQVSWGGTPQTARYRFQSSAQVI